MAPRVPAYLLSIASLGVACTPELSDQSLVDKFRVLAIRVTPASGEPGTEVVAEALWSETRQHVDPSFTLWAACFPLPGQSGRQCIEGSVDPEDPMGRWRILGTGAAATFTLPDLAEDEEAKEVYLVFAACTGLVDIPDCECPGPECEECLADVDPFEVCAEGEDALAFKSVESIRDPAEGNHNPAIVRVLRDDEPWEEDDVPTIDCPEQGCEPWSLGVRVTPESAEPYTVERMGEQEQWVEEPYVSWFATAGSYAADRTNVGESEPELATVDWTPSTEEISIDFYFVVYDGRGGVDWAVREAVTTGP
jgi:hypothetical protein